MCATYMVVSNQMVCEDKDNFKDIPCIWPSFGDFERTHTHIKTGGNGGKNVVKHEGMSRIQAKVAWRQLNNQNTISFS